MGLFRNAVVQHHGILPHKGERHDRERFQNPKQLDPGAHGKSHFFQGFLHTFYRQLAQEHGTEEDQARRLPVTVIMLRDPDHPDLIPQQHRGSAAAFH